MSLKRDLWLKNHLNFPIGGGYGESKEDAIEILLENNLGILLEKDIIACLYCNGEYVFKLIEQVLIEDNDRKYDILTIELPNHKRKNIYFNVSNFFGKSPYKFYQRDDVEYVDLVSKMTIRPSIEEEKGWFEEESLDENEQSQEEPLQIAGEEYLKITAVAKSFLETGVSDNPPKFVLFTGGVGAGKTTLRREKYSEGYVHFEAGEVLVALEKLFDKKDQEKLAKIAQLTSEMILDETFKNRFNLVSEIIGDNEFSLSAVIESLLKIGYKVEISHTNADVVESYKRHLQAVDTDPDYYSSYFMQDATIASLIQQASKQNP